jgi:hypothetical protein
MCHVLFYVKWFEAGIDCSLCWYWWNYWPSLLKLSFHNLTKVTTNIKTCKFILHTVTRCTSNTTLCNKACKWLSTSGSHGRHRMVVGFTTTCAISTYHHYKVVISNRAHDEVYSIQHYTSLNRQWLHKQVYTLTGLTLPYFCACPKPGLGFLTSFVMVFFVFS